MPIPVDRTGELRTLVELLGSLGLTFDQQTVVLDGCRRELDEHVQRLRAEPVAAEGHDTGLGSTAGGRILPLREAERRHLVAALRHTGGKIYGRDGAARLLDLKPTTLQSKLKKHGINRLDAAGEDGSLEGPSEGSTLPPASESQPPPSSGNGSNQAMASAAE